MAAATVVPWWRVLWLRFYWVRIVPWLQGVQLGLLLLRHKEMEPLALDYLRTYPSLPFAMELSTQERVRTGNEFSGALTYGETPWMTFVKILEHVPIGPDDVFVDLGCGAGFLCLLVAKVYGIRVLGIDLIADFIERNQRLAAQHGLDGLEFRTADITTTDLHAGTIFYMTCTCFPRSLMDRLAERLSQQPPGTWIITVTRPLDHPAFEVIKQLKARYSWGQDEVYIQRVR